MATFKVGDRVRIVNARRTQRYVGKTATVVEIKTPGNWTDGMLAAGAPPESTAYRLSVDGVGIYAPEGYRIGFEAWCLVPLTDPKADAFLEKIRQLKPLPVQEIV